MKCPKCKCSSGDDWTQCGGDCPLPMSPHYKAAAPAKKAERRKWWAQVYKRNGWFERVNRDKAELLEHPAYEHVHIAELRPGDVIVPRETWEKVERALENSCACITSREPCSACEAFAAMRNL